MIVFFFFFVRKHGNSIIKNVKNKNKKIETRFFIIIGAHFLELYLEQVKVLEL